MRAGCVLLIGVLLACAGCGQRRGSAARSAIPAALNDANESARTIPAGTRLVLSVIPGLHADGQPASVYDAVVMRDVRNQAGEVLIGKGSPARLAIVDGKPALRTVMIYGNAYRVRVAGSLDRMAPLDVVTDSSSLPNLKTNEIVRFQTSTAAVLVSPR